VISATARGYKFTVQRTASRVVVGVSLTGIGGNASGRGGHCRSGWASDGGHGELSDLVSGESERAEVGAVDASSALACPELVGEDGELGDFWRSASLIS
jgi:hypothetical protein